MIRIRDGRDFAAGLFFVLIGIIALFGMSGLHAGTAMRMGPAYIPSLLAWGMIGLGGAIAIKALIVPGPDLEKWAWGPLALICGGVALFGLAVPLVGLVLANILAVLVACLGVQGTPWLHRIVFAIVLSGCAALLFHGLLGLPMPLWPW